MTMSAVIMVVIVVIVIVSMLVMMIVCSIPGKTTITLSQLP